MLFAIAQLAASAAAQFPACATRRASSVEDPSRHAQPQPFIGGDLEHPGVIEAALAARAPSKELIFLSVGDTRDHRRQYKDPALRTISLDFLLNLLSNFRTLGIEHHFLLTTKKLCKQVMQGEHCQYNCAWTSLWHDHPSLTEWSLKAGDMFLMWAQQWRYICRAIELGYRVLRTDTDVYFAEDPYPILAGPLFRQYSMLVQQDFGGPLGGRPSCANAHGATGGGTCGNHRGTALLNIGLLYVRSSANGGAFAVINGTWARFLTMLSGPRNKQDVQALIDQPLMRQLVDELAVPDDELQKRSRGWVVMRGDAGAVYGGADSCALRADGACASVAAERAKTPFLVQTVRPRARPNGAPTAERVALAPDWLFGRGCLTHVRQPAKLMRAARGVEAERATRCRQPPDTGRLAMPAPGPAAGLLVATHFVYSMALKRKRTFRAFGWDASPKHNRTSYADGTCWERAQKGVVFGHTFFAQTEAKSILCAMPQGQDSECACCAGMPSLQDLQKSDSPALRLETTGGSSLRDRRHMATLEGCADYQMFWD